MVKEDWSTLGLSVGDKLELVFDCGTNIIRGVITDLDSGGYSTSDYYCTFQVDGRYDDVRIFDYNDLRAWLSNGVARKPFPCEGVQRRLW